MTMLACARLGVIHSVVFGGFSGEACGQRAADSKSHVLIRRTVITAAGSWWTTSPRRTLRLRAAQRDGQAIEKVLVWRRREASMAPPIPMVKGRDFFIDEALKVFRQAGRSGVDGLGSSACSDVH